MIQVVEPHEYLENLSHKNCGLCGEIKSHDIHMKQQPFEYDPVEAPRHYMQGGLTPVEVAVAWKLGFILGNVIKYVGRSAHSGRELEDLRKARKYLEMQIELVEKGELKESIKHGKNG